MTEEITSNTPAPDAFEAALAANADDLATPVAEVVAEPISEAIDDQSTSDQ